MKIGDLVEFHNRFFREDGRALNAPSGTYLVVAQLSDLNAVALDMPGLPITKWTRWNIINIETGKVYNQITRDLEVISE